MPKWPAYVMAAAAAACALPAFTTPPPPEPERYAARGQDHGWTLQIANGRIDYRGEGEKRIVAARPHPHPTSNGRRYETRRLVADISHGRCNDASNGQGYEHQVVIIADGRAYEGCGGERRPEWDA